MHVGNYLGLAHASDDQLADALTTVADHHGDEPDVHETCLLLAAWSRDHRATLAPLIERYAEQKSAEPERLKQTLFQEPRGGSLALLRDLHDLWLLANEVNLCWTVLAQAARALRDKELTAACTNLSHDTERQIAWLHTRIAQAAPQALVVAS